MNSADEIKRFFENAELGINPNADEKVFQDIFQAQRKITKKAPAVPGIWRVTIKKSIAKFAVAAIVVIACVIGLSLLRGTQSGIALADVLSRIEQVKSYRSQWSAKVTGEDPGKPYISEIRGTWLVSQKYGWKGSIERLDPNGGESMLQELYFSPEKRTKIIVWPMQKKYRRTEFDDHWAEQWPDYDPRTMTKRILECKYKSLGGTTIDGIEVEGFQTTDPNWSGNNPNMSQIDVKMWVDLKTQLPVRYDYTYVLFGPNEGKIIERDNYVVRDFQWDLVVDAAEFEPVIPDDYSGRVVKYPARITEETVIQSMKLIAELLGKYPEGIFDFVDVRDFTTPRSAFGESQTPAATRLREEMKGLTEDQIANKLADFMIPIRGCAMFYSRLQWDKKDPAYYGKTVTSEDSDKVLMRWKVSDNEYRVIYGDLHVESVTPEKLAELEAALPK
ncbi:MAG: hypothetical protein JW715_03175 [Sedimentisphaerales bacterium]|nr:hypothetical protein [Sedimentisphaerales bacterium]